eukprot:89556-Pleurochrysis_carterae.AAC.1
MGHKQSGSAIQGTIHVKSSYASLRRQYIAVFDERRIIRMLSWQPCCDVIEPRSQIELRRVLGRLRNGIGFGVRVVVLHREWIACECMKVYSPWIKTDVLPIKVEQNAILRGACVRAARSRACVAAAVCSS